MIDYAFGNASIVLPQILGGLGVEQIALNAYFDAAKVRTFRNDRERHLQQLASVVRSLEANLGVLIDADGETVTLVDDAGEHRRPQPADGAARRCWSRAQARRADRDAADDALASSSGSRPRTARRSCARAATAAR